MEKLYQLYFQIASIPPFGEIDWSIRRFLGMLFNDASSKADMKMIRQLSNNRETACRMALNKKDKTGHSEYSIEIRVLSPDEPLNLALRKTKASYILLSRVLTVPPESRLMGLLEAGWADPEIAVLELSPSLRSQYVYVDPITLEVPYSTMELVLIRADAITAVGEFDSSLSPAAQALDMSYRLRSHGYRLVRPTNLPAEGGNNDATPIHGCDLVFTKWAMRKKYSRLLNARRDLKAVPSRLWKQDYEIGFGSPTRPFPQNRVKLPIISVIIRTYTGRQHWLHQSLCSALNQTYPNLEILVVEDGTDESREEIERISAQQNVAERSIQYLTQEKLGKSCAGNLALENSTGQYICFLDDDDLLYPHHIEELFNVMQSTPSNPAAYSLAWEVHTRPDSETMYSEEYYEVAQHTRGPFSHEKLSKLNFLPIQSVLFSRGLYSQLGGFDPSREFLEDWDLWLRYSENSTFTYLPIVTSLYRTAADPYQRIDRVKLEHRRSISNNRVAA